MAERVQRSLESTLPELEELEKAGIFNKEEIRTIVKKRRRLEYRLLRRPARVADYLRAIQYEVNLDLLRKHRIKSHGVGSRVRDAEHSITARLHTLFQRALKKFKGNVRLWLQYIEFCKRVKHHHTLGKLYGKVLALHPRTSGLWIMAAKYQLEEEKNAAAARTLLQRAIRINTECKQLWQEYFRMELLHVDQMVKRHNVLTGVDTNTGEEVAISDEFMANKTAMIVYKAAVAAIPGDIDFQLSFLPISKLFANNADLQEQIWTSIQGDFPNEPIMWDALARRQWNEVDTSLLSEDQVMQLEESSYRVYKEAVTKHPSADMYEKLIGWCLERLQQHGSHPSQMLQRLLDILQMATDNDCMNLNSYKVFVTLLLDTGKMAHAHQIAEAASWKHPECLELWQVRLSSPMATNEEKKEWMELALKRSPNESVLLDLWQLYLKWSIIHEQDSSAIVELFERAMDSVMGHAKSELLVSYIDWLLVAMGIDDVRRQYAKIISNNRPIALNVCYKCIDIEENQDTPDTRRIHQLYETALSDHGHDDIKLWLRYMKFEASGVGGDLYNVGKLYWKAMKTLSPHLISVFITEHTLQQNST